MGTVAVEADASAVEPEKPVLEGKATLGAKGRLVIPQALREALGLEVGDVLDMHIEDHELRMSTRWGRLERTQERMRAFFGPDRILSDELSAERRLAALEEERD